MKFTQYNIELVRSQLNNNVMTGTHNMDWDSFEYYIESMLTSNSFGFHSIHIELTRNQLNKHYNDLGPTQFIIIWTGVHLSIILNL